MLTGKFRPWGDLKWIMKKMDDRDWFFIGCVSTEDRCVSAFRTLHNHGWIKKSIFWEIIDPVTESEHTRKRGLNRAGVIAVDNDVTNHIYSADLMLQDGLLHEAINQFLSDAPPNLIIDISCLPKRFFFPLIKIAMQYTGINNLLIVYSKPTYYCKGDLSDDPDPWYPLPLFMDTSFPSQKYELAIVGTGFMPFSLPKLLKDKHSEISLRLLFPFPPGPPNYQRSWEFVRKIEKHYNFKTGDEIIRINSMDVCETFDHICSATNYGESPVLFAPYGPKPMSLAMCIYASLSGSPVYYTQPKYYNPNYSVGTGESFGYCLKMGGNNLYTISI